MPSDLTVPEPVEGAGLLFTAIALFSNVQEAMTSACATDRDAAINAAIDTICFMRNPYLLLGGWRIGIVKISCGTNCLLSKLRYSFRVIQVLEKCVGSSARTFSRRPWIPISPNVAVNALSIV